jgi:hypothetical protein
MLAAAASKFSVALAFRMALFSATSSITPLSARSASKRLMKSDTAALSWPICTTSDDSASSMLPAGRAVTSVAIFFRSISANELTVPRSRLSMPKACKVSVCACLPAVSKMAEVTVAAAVAVPGAAARASTTVRSFDRSVRMSALMALSVFRLLRPRSVSWSSERRPVSSLK